MTQDNDNEPSSSNSSSSSSSSSHNIPISSTSKAKIHVPASSTQDVQHLVSIVKALTKKVDNLQNFQSGPYREQEITVPKTHSNFHLHSPSNIKFGRSYTQKKDDCVYTNTLWDIHYRTNLLSNKSTGVYSPSSIFLQPYNHVSFFPAANVQPVSLTTSSSSRAPPSGIPTRELRCKRYRRAKSFQRPWQHGTNEEKQKNSKTLLERTTSALFKKFSKITNTEIFNLSSTVLSPLEKIVLGLGIKYLPLPKTTTENLIVSTQQATEVFHRRLRLTFAFPTLSIAEPSKIPHNTTKVPWNPAPHPIDKVLTKHVTQILHDSRLSLHKRNHISLQLIIFY